MHDLRSTLQNLRDNELDGERRHARIRIVSEINPLIEQLRRQSKTDAGAIQILYAVSRSQYFSTAELDCVLDSLIENYCTEEMIGAAVRVVDGLKRTVAENPRLQL